MYDNEKQRATHLLLLLTYTFLTIALTAESFLMGWEISAVVLLLLGLVACWVMHITETVPENIRIWLYFVLMMLAFFFYGVHDTSVFDLAPVMIVVIILFISTERYIFIKLCMGTYYFTMIYDFIFVIRGRIEISPLEISRICLHFVVVCVAGQLAKIQIQRQGKERKVTESIIGDLEETNRRTEDFLTNVSHELRTPINAVTGITNTMLKSERDEKKREDITAIQIAGQRLFNQIGDILDYTEIDTGRISLSEEKYMISSLINDIVMGNPGGETGKKIDLIFDVDAAMPSILLGDERKIKKILLHLIDNAYKFSKKGGIYVRMYTLKKPYGVNLCINVTDTGSGISEDELEKISDRFYQSNGGRNRRAGGLGLGLSIVYGMVAAMEGFIHIESEEGKGTSVSVSVPQKVVDELPCMAIADKEDLCLACYLRPEKYEVPEVRDFYNSLIDHMVEGLDMPLHRVDSIEELSKLMSVYQLTHLFIGKEEYEENSSYFESLNNDIKIIVISDDEGALNPDSRIKLLKKPFYCLPVVNILNARTTEAEELLKEKNLVCPGVRVLVVDDEPMNLMVAEGIFKGYEMEVETAESGKEALERCKNEDFDLIFLDHMMPEMDGVETIHRLRRLSDELDKEFTVIAFTANAVSGAREMFLGEGFDEFISKPIETLELDRLLKKVLPKTAVTYVDVEKIQTSAPAEQGRDKNCGLEEVGINVNSGMQYYGGDKTFYEELLIKFARDAKQKAENLNAYYDKGDYKNYDILVHALKSTAKMIGADELSEKAKALEMAAKKMDGDFISQNHEELMSTYKEVVMGIATVFDIKEEDSKAVDNNNMLSLSADELLSKLDELKGYMESYDVDDIETLISELSNTMYEDKPVADMLEDIALDVENFDFSQAAEKTGELIDEVKGGVAQ